MIDITSGTVGTITIPLLEGKAPLVPEAGSVFYSILDQTGAATTVMRNVRTARPRVVSVPPHQIMPPPPTALYFFAQSMLPP